MGDTTSVIAAETVLGGGVDRIIRTPYERTPGHQRECCYEGRGGCMGDFTALSYATGHQTDVDPMAKAVVVEIDSPGD